MLMVDCPQYGIKRIPCWYSRQYTVRVSVKMGVRDLYNSNAHEARTSPYNR